MGSQKDSTDMDQVMGPGRIPAYTGDKLNGRNWTAFEFGFTSHLMGLDLVKVLTGATDDKAIRNRVFSILVSALESNQYILVSKTRDPQEAWDSLKAFYRKKSGQSRLLLTQRFRHAKMDENSDLYSHLTMMSNLADELDEVMSSKIQEDDFMTTVCFSLMGIQRFTNVVEIIMNGPDLTRQDLLNKLMATEERHISTKAAAELEPLTAMKMITKRKTKQRPDVECYNCGKKGHYKRDCRSPKKSEEAARTATATEFIFAAHPRGKETSPKSWLLDSGASAHMVARIDQLTDVQPIATPTIVVLGDGRELRATHKGQAKISPRTTLKDVLYVPGLQENLLSVSMVGSKKGAKVVIENGICKVMIGNEVAIVAVRQDGVFRVHAKSAGAIDAEADILELHRRCGHASFSTVLTMSKQGILPPVRRDANVEPFCEICLQGKMTRTEIPKKSRKLSSRPGDLIHTDVCGPMRTRSLQGNIYMIGYMDDASGWIHLAFVKRKSDQLKEFKALEAAFERQYDTKIKCLRSDGGGEYTSRDALDYLKSKGIKWQRSAPRTPQHNGRAERLNRTVMEMARCLMSDAKLAPDYWQYAATMAAYIRNRMPTTSNPNNATPFEILNGVKPDLKNMPLFGATAQVHVPDELRGKLDPKSRSCIFLGYADGAKAGVFESTDTGRRFVSRDAVVERRKLRYATNVGPTPAIAVRETQSAPTSSENEEVKEPATGQKEDSVVVTTTSTLEEPEEEQPKRRERRAPVRFMHEWAMAARGAHVSEPDNAREALKSTEWQQAMEEEYRALEKNGTWELVQRPGQRSVVSGKWCFRAKTDAAGKITRYKARYVARGFTQRPGIDFDETTSPVVSLTSLRTVLAVATSLDMEIKQLDVDSAFLYGTLEEEIYLEQPAGFEKSGPNGEQLVCRLRKAIYGLKQAGRVWWELIDAHLRASGFHNAAGDPCVYRRRHNGQMTFLAIYVDDMVVASQSAQAISDLEHDLRKRFAMKPIGDVSFVLGVRIERDRDAKSMTLSQSTYAKTVLERFGMMDCRPVHTPAAAGTTLDVNEVGAVEYPYSQAVGSLMYLAMATRPDLAQAVGMTSRFASNPSAEHVKAVKHILRYLRGTVDLGIRFGGSRDTSLTGYVDADFAGCSASRRSTTGIIFLTAGGPVSWASRRQDCVALSTTEAEYIALCVASQEAVWLRGLLQDLGQAQTEPTIIKEDNQSTIALATNGRTSRRSKHIEVRFHFTRSKIEDGSIRLEYCPTGAMIADLMTKPLASNAFSRLRRTFMAPCTAGTSSGGSVETRARGDATSGTPV